MAQTPEEEARARLQAQVSAASAVAEQSGVHEGHWRLHHTVLTSGPGDFTPYNAPEFVEEVLSPFGEWLEQFAELLGLEHGQAVAGHELEAGT
jgi:hypothetical protein